MHSLMTRAGRVVVVLVALAATVGVFATGSEPALADDPPCTGCSHHGNRTGLGYSAAAAFVIVHRRRKRCVAPDRTVPVAPPRSRSPHTVEVP